MPCTLDATVAGPLSNTYATIVEADAYWQSHLRPDEWLNRDADIKCRALIQATTTLDMWVTWGGVASTYTQALAWPRWGLYTTAGQPIDPMVLPPNLKGATAELARLLCVTDLAERPDYLTAGLEEVSAGPVTLRFAQPGSTAGGSGLGDADRIIPPRIYGLIAPWATGKRGASTTTPLLRV